MRRENDYDLDSAGLKGCDYTLKHGAKMRLPVNVIPAEPSLSGLRLAKWPLLPT